MGYVNKILRRICKYASHIYGALILGRTKVRCSIYFFECVNVSLPQRIEHTQPPKFYALLDIWQKKSSDFHIAAFAVISIACVGSLLSAALLD